MVKALQLAINRFCLLEAEKGVLAFEIDMDALDGTDMLARYRPTKWPSGTAGCSWMRSAMTRVRNPLA